MTPGTARVFRRVRTVSTVAALFAVAVSMTASLFGATGTAQWQVWLAVAAIAVGIPHGAMDHLVTVPSMQPARMALFILGYLAVTALVVVAILQWNVIGFIAVVVMSAVHFGVGDAAFLRQLSTQRSRVPWFVYALPAGALPVVVPLTSAQADAALTLVNPGLVAWDQGTAPLLLGATLVAGVVGVVWLVIARQYRDAVDLIALGLLALLTPPLVAFAVYFGLWHAQRHTARLVLELPGATARAEHSAAAGFVKAVLPGLPALIGTLVIAGGLTWWTGGSLPNDYLWIVLVVIWALTVPHMALTWRLDRQALTGDSASSQSSFSTVSASSSSSSDT